MNHHEGMTFPAASDFKETCDTVDGQHLPSAILQLAEYLPYQLVSKTF